MEIIYKQYSNEISIQHYTIYNDMLYIIVGDINHRLICFDLKRRYLVYEKFINEHIFNKYTYIHKDTIYNLEHDSLTHTPLNGEDIYDFDEDIIKLFIFNDEIHYIIKKDVKNYDDNNIKKDEGLYNLVDMSKNLLLTIKIDNNIRFEDNILYIPFIENMTCS